MKSASFAVIVWCVAVGQVPAAELAIEAPRPRQVVQRRAFEPAQSHEHAIGGPKLGFADVPVTLKSSRDPGPLQWRVVLLPGGYGRTTEWADLQTVESRSDGGDRRLTATARVPAGGWYRLEIRRQAPDGAVNGKPANKSKGQAGVDAGVLATVEPLGAGEVLLIAGQSYAAGANDALLTIDDPGGRVSALDPVTGKWQLANDPQPQVGTGGTIWPPTANALLPVLRVPIGFVNVASGGTSSRQWMPGTPLYRNLASAATGVGRFRAILWQQGESDVIEKIETEKYVANLTTIQRSLARDLGWSPSWLLAKSTLHPTVYNLPSGEGSIRAAVDQLCKLPGFRPGPDTDLLAGENRGGRGSRRHFSPIGQQRAGLLWFAAILTEIERQARLESSR